MSFSDLLADTDDATLTHLAGAEVVVYRDGAGNETTVRAIFEAKHQTSSLGESGISDCAPSLFLRLEDLPTNPREDLDALFLVDDRAYSARDVQRDGQGAALILLHLEEE